MIGYFLAIGAAAIWSGVALSATRIVRYFGSYNYNLLRLLGIIFFFFPYVYLNWKPIYFNESIFTAIFFSSIIGIIIGDTFLFVCLKRLGPRRQALLFSMQIPFTIILAEVFLKTLPSVIELIGCSLIFIGIIIAIQFNKTIPEDDLENIQGNKYIGLLAGIGLALCQSIGIILMKPALTSTDPIIVSYLRVIVAAIIMFVSLFFIKNNQLWERMYVWYDGKINPCDFDYKSFLSVGNIKNNSLEEIWNSNEYNSLRKKHIEKKRSDCFPCDRCPL